MWTLSCRQAPPHLQCIVNCCQVTMDQHRVSRPREQPLQTPFVSLRGRQCPVFSLHNHPVPTSCHFMTAKSEESAAVPTNDPSTHPALQDSLVGSCFCLLRLFQNHSLLSATVYAARTLRRLNPVSSVLILLAMKEQARHAGLFQGLVPSSDVNCKNTHWFSPRDLVFSELKTPEVQAQITSPDPYYLL